jgi:L-ascorbate metabolism protein UlaG (beta-lactamase superfamily)
MRISKHIHSCLLIEEQGKTILIDPGIFTYNEKALEIDALAELDYIVITHEHPDHMHIPLIKDLVNNFPEAKIITNSAAASLLAKEKITAATEGDSIIRMQIAPHEKLWDTRVPQNVLVTIFDKLTHPGDSLHFQKTNEILCLPIQAPWGSTTAAVEKALQLKPKVIIPIHDWMWKDSFRAAMYQRLTEFFTKHDIAFKSLETNQIVEI